MAHRTVEINSNLPFLFTSGEKYLTGITTTAMHALVRYIEANVALFLPDTHAVKLVKKVKGVRMLKLIPALPSASMKKFYEKLCTVMTLDLDEERMMY